MNVLVELENVLAEEQKILLEGDYTKLEDLAQKKSGLAEQLAQGSTEFSKDDVEKLALQATHNEALLASARRGIQAAMSQLKEYSSGEHQSTYSAEGHRAPLSKPVSMARKY